MSRSSKRKRTQRRFSSVILVVGLPLVLLCGLAWWLKPVDGRLPMDRYRPLLMVLWWIVVFLYTTVLGSLAVLTGWHVLKRVVGSVKRRSTRCRRGQEAVQTERRKSASTVARAGFVRRFLLPAWFTSILIVVEFEIIGAVLLFWNSRPHLKLLPQELPAIHGEFSITAIGGSTTEGWPFHEFVSFPSIVQWRLEYLFPDLRVRVDNLAYGGAYLENMYEKLSDLKARPDVLIVYSGHNEFPNRFPLQREAESSYYGFYHPSLLSRAIVKELEHTGITVAARKGPRKFFDRHVCTPGEERLIYERFRHTLEEILRFCIRNDTLAILMIPASNESGYEPNRSLLPAKFSSSKYARLRAIYEQIRADQLAPVEEISLLKEARRLAPAFAETWYRLGQAYESTERFDKARNCYQMAIDTDGYPGRATSRLAGIYRELAARHDCVLLDAGEVLSRLSHNGILGYEQFLDDVHPTLSGYVTLANAVLLALKERGMPRTDWPDSAHEATVAEVTKLFGVNRAVWSKVCEYETWLHNELAALRYDPSVRLAKAEAYVRAAQAIRAGSSPEEVGIPGLVLSKGTIPRTPEK